jgi:hypothetical protein
MSISATTPATAPDYQKQYAAFKQYNTQELLYASFLSPEQAIENGNEVLQQAAQLLSSKSYETATPPNLSAGSGTDTPASTGSDATGGTTTASATPPRQSVAAILAASDDAANVALTAYSKAPAGSSLIDFQV